MKISWMGFLGTNHSWSVCGQNISRSLIKQGHEVHLLSSNGYERFPEDLKPHIREKLDLEYDIQLTYTAMKNFPLYLGAKCNNKFGIWCYEFISKHNPLPDGFAKFYKSTDKMLPPSEFAKEIFINSGVPESHMEVVPHGINFDQLDEAKPYGLKTTKSAKILVVIAQVHRRKNLAGMLEMYGRAFTKKDDVCLVIKVQDSPPKQSFELSFGEIFGSFKRKFKDHAEVEIVREFVPNIYSLYKACDIVFYATHCEGFGLISLEALAASKINITSRYGGVLDFCDDDNSLLIDGKEFIVQPNFLYWTQKNNSKAFMPNIDDGVEKLKYAVANREMLLQKAAQQAIKIRNNYSWDKITNQIIGLIK